VTDDEFDDETTAVSPPTDELIAALEEEDLEIIADAPPITAPEIPEPVLEETTAPHWVCPYCARDAVEIGAGNPLSLTAIRNVRAIAFGRGEQLQCFRARSTKAGGWWYACQDLTGDDAVRVYVRETIRILPPA
jgi:hypothetical protein